MSYTTDLKNIFWENINILIADESNEEVQKSIGAIQNKFGKINIKYAQNIVELNHIASIYNPDLIITEICLGHLNSKQLVENLKNTFPTIPIVIYTHQENENLIIAELAQIVDDYVLKENDKRLTFAVIKQVSCFTLKMESQLEVEQYEKYINLYRRWESNLDGVIFIFTLSGNGEKTISYISSNSKDLFGLPQEDFVKNYNCFDSLLFPGESERIDGLLKISAQTLEPVVTKIKFIIRNNINWFSLNVKPYSSGSNDITWEGLLLNISKQKFAEEKLIKEQNFLLALMNNSPDAIYFKDLESRFIRINEGYIKKINVKSSEEILGKTDFDIFDADHAIDARQDELNIISTGKPK